MHNKLIINIALTLAYDGKEFFGWQKTKIGPTIEESVTTVLEQIVQEPVTLQAASRTDKGVHAEGQVVNCYIKNQSLNTLFMSLNRLLPPSIRVYKIERKEDNFHASLSVINKKYRYKIYAHTFCPPQLRHNYWHIYFPLTIENMEKAASYLLGTHDFSAFYTQQENLEPQNKVCTLSAITISQESAKSYIIEVIGNRFLYKMVRTIVGTLVQVGQNKITPYEVQAILASKNRSYAGITAPAHGLTLQEVYYDRT